MNTSTNMNGKSIQPGNKRMLLLQVGEEGVEVFAPLAKKGWVIIADDKSARFLRKLGVEYLSVEQIAGGFDAFSLNLLSSRLLAGILTSRDDEVAMRSLFNKGLDKIDMIVVSLPMGGDPMVEGGNSTLHSLVLAATQNIIGVTIVIDSEDYRDVVKEILSSGENSFETRTNLGVKVFYQLSSHYFSLANVAKFQLERGQPVFSPSVQ